MTTMNGQALIESWIEHFPARIYGMSNDYYQETFNWSPGGLEHSKSLPHGGSESSLSSMRQISNYLFNNSIVVRSCIEKMGSYVIGPGHTYDVTRKFIARGKSGSKPSENMLSEIKWSIQDSRDGVFPTGWLSLQEETFKRYLRDGELFRRIFDTRAGVQVRFIEPYQIKNPPRNVLTKMGLDPDVFERRIQMGIESANDSDVVGVAYYWVNDDPNDNNSFQRVPAANMQHIKYGADANDPRGIPPFWIAMCHHSRIQEVERSMCDLLVTQASYAVVRQYESYVTPQEMRRLASGITSNGDGGSPDNTRTKEIEAKGFSFEFPSMGVNPESFISVVESEESFIASILDMPVSMLTGRGAGSTRANGVASEGPFSRRVNREQIKVSNYDVELLWRIVRDGLGYDKSRYADVRKGIRIGAGFSSVQPRDLLKESQAVSTLIATGIESLEGGAERIGNDYEIVRQQREAEGMPLTPLNAIQKPSTGNPSPQRTGSKRSDPEAKPQTRGGGAGPQKNPQR